MSFFPYLWILLQIIALLKGIKILVLAYFRRLDWIDLVDLRPYGREHIKVRDIARSKQGLVKTLLIVLLYAYSFFISILVIGALYLVIFYWLNR